jgi:hypothetical protein
MFCPEIDVFSGKKQGILSVPAVDVGKGLFRMGDRDIRQLPT